MNESEMRAWIDNASYEQLLYKWRMALSGDPFFMGDIGDYYSKVMSEKKNALSHADQVATSKSIGW